MGHGLRLPRRANKTESVALTCAIPTEERLMGAERLIAAELVIRHQAADLVDLRDEVAELRVKLTMAEQDGSLWREMAQVALTQLADLTVRCDRLTRGLRAANQTIRNYVLPGNGRKAAA